MSRRLGSGQMGIVRALRLPVSLDRWFEERLRERPDASSSKLLLELIHSGLRIVPGYMLRHRTELERLQVEGDVVAYHAYLSALRHTFGERYIAHLEAWIDTQQPVSVPFCKQ